MPYFVAMRIDLIAVARQGVVSTIVYCSDAYDMTLAVARGRAGFVSRFNIVWCSRQINGRTETS